MEQSYIRWRFKIEELPNPSAKTKKIQKEFIEWLSIIEVKIRVDFLKYCSCKHKILTDENYIQINTGKNYQYFKLEQRKYGQRIYKSVENCLENRQIAIIAEIKVNREVIVYSKLEEESKPH